MLLLLLCCACVFVVVAVAAAAGTTSKTGLPLRRLATLAMEATGDPILVLLIACVGSCEGM